MRFGRFLRQPEGIGRLVALPLLLAATFVAAGESVAVAVASNFREPAAALAEAFETETRYPVLLSVASTGKLYAQIVNGAPFDVFLAADRVRPERLEADGRGAPGTRFTYALGGLVLWSRDPLLADRDCRAALEADGNWRLAIANPELAPYGLAAQSFLEHEGLWERLGPRLVYGENIAQALHFVATGNARLGLIAASQAGDERLPAATCAWRVPPALHAPIEQQAILVTRAADNEAARAFLDYLRGAAGRALIERFGYATVP